MGIHVFFLFLPLLFGWDSDTATSFHFEYHYTGYVDETLEIIADPLLNDAYSQIGVDLNFYPDTPIPVFIRNDTGSIRESERAAWGRSGEMKMVLSGQDLHLGGDPIFTYRAGQEIRNIAYYQTVLIRRVRSAYLRAVLAQKIKTPMPAWFRAGLIAHESWGGAGLSGTEKQLLNRPVDMYPPLSSINLQNASQDYSLSSALVKDFFSFLVDRYGKFNIQELLRRMGNGTSFDEAIEGVYLTDLEYIEEDWKFDRDFKYSNNSIIR